MKHRFSIPALSVCFGAVGFLLRLLQNRTGFEPDTGLPIPGSVPAILLPILLMAAAGILYLAVRRVLPKEMPELPFSRQFDLSNRTGLFSALAGGCVMAISGILEIVDSMGGSAAAVSADGMEIVSVNTGAGGSGLMIGALSVAAGVCLAAAVIAGIDLIFKTGGAQAVAALAYGTESVPAVDKIVGPGNIYVATAKRKVFG